MPQIEALERTTDKNCARTLPSLPSFRPSQAGGDQWLGKWEGDDCIILFQRSCTLGAAAQVRGKEMTKKEKCPFRSCRVECRSAKQVRRSRKIKERALNDNRIRTRAAEEQEQQAESGWE